MKILLDEKLCGVSQAACINDAITGAAAVARQRGRVIVDVFVDGERWTHDKLSAEQAGLAAAEEVRLFTAHPGELVRQTLVEAGTALGHADILQREAAEMIQADQYRGGMTKLAEAMSIWRSVQEAVMGGAELLGLDLDNVVYDGQPVRQIFARMSEHLVSLKNALTASDPISVADTLLYELPEVVEQWRGLLDHLQNLAGEKPEADDQERGRGDQFEEAP